MAKTLYFNALRLPKLPLVMGDAEKTNIIVTAPSEGLVEELQSAGPELQKIMESNDSDGIMACYDLAARLISCNQSGLQVTAEELRGKYALDLYGLIFFFNAYSDFIIEIQNAKN